MWGKYNPSFAVADAKRMPTMAAKDTSIPSSAGTLAISIGNWALEESSRQGVTFPGNSQTSLSIGPESRRSI